MNSQVLAIFLIFILSITVVPSHSKPLNGMTRIQNVLRTLMGNKPGMHDLHARGKKLFPDKVPVIEVMEDLPSLQYPYQELNNDRIYFL